MNYLKRITWSVVDEKELSVCGAPPDTVISSWHKPCDTAKKERVFSGETRLCFVCTGYIGVKFNCVTHEKSCLGSSSSLSPYSSFTFSVGDTCWKGRRLCSCRTNNEHCIERKSHREIKHMADQIIQLYEAMSLFILSGELQELQEKSQSDMVRLTPSSVCKWIVAGKNVKSLFQPVLVQI